MISRSRFLSLAAVALSAILSGPTLALAQDAPEGPQAVLNQLDNAVPGDQGTILSSRFTATPISDKIAADDFLVPAGMDWWSVTAVSFIGRMCLEEGNGDLVQVVFYRNDGPQDDGKPGAVVATARATVVQGSGGSCSSSNPPVQYDLNLQTASWLLPGQKYWMSVHAVVENSGSLTLSRALYWSARTGYFNQPAFYYSGGSLSACNQEWVERRVCDSQAAGDDMTWALTYTPFEGNLLYLPALSRN